MPHSGGGGSHSGGHSHSSSSHSRGGSHSSGPSYTRGQSTPYPGARRYVYYYDRRPCYYYSTSTLGSMDYKGKFLTMLMFGIIWALVWGICSIVFVEKVDGGKLDTSGIDDTIYVYDYADVIDDHDEYILIDYLEGFRDNTGIVFSVVTYPSHQMGSNMEIESYNQYVSMFYDESHWLIYYVGSEYDRSDDWEWNLMCGDDCARILGTKQEDKFVEEFHANLLRSMSFADAVISAVDKLQPNLSPGYIYRDGTYVNGEYVGGQPASALIPALCITMSLVGVLIAIASIALLIAPVPEQHKAKMKATVVDGTPEYVKCDYCNGQVVKGSVTQCPYCGAHLKLL